MSKKYVIINSGEVSSINFDEVLESSSDTLRYNADGTKTFVKYEGTQPFSLLGKTEYTHSEILAILAGDEWTPSDPS